MSDDHFKTLISYVNGRFMKIGSCTQIHTRTMELFLKRSSHSLHRYIDRTGIDGLIKLLFVNILTNASSNCTNCMVFLFCLLLPFHLALLFLFSFCHSFWLRVRTMLASSSLLSVLDLSLCPAYPWFLCSWFSECNLGVKFFCTVAVHFNMYICICIVYSWMFIRETYQKSNYTRLNKPKNIWPRKTSSLHILARVPWWWYLG